MDREAALAARPRQSACRVSLVPHSSCLQRVSASGSDAKTFSGPLALHRTSHRLSPPFSTSSIAARAPCRMMVLVMAMRLAPSLILENRRESGRVPASMAKSVMAQPRRGRLFEPTGCLDQQAVEAIGTRSGFVSASRFSISDFEELLAARDIVVSREVVRCWVIAFRRLSAADLRGRRCGVGLKGFHDDNWKAASARPA